MSFLIKNASLLYYSLRPSDTYGIGCSMTSKKPTVEELICEDNYADIEDDEYDDVDDQDDSMIKMIFMILWMCVDCSMVCRLISLALTSSGGRETSSRNDVDL